MIDSKIIEQARNTDLVAFIEKYNGFTFAHRNGEYRCKQHPSLAIKHDRLSWYWHSKGIGGHGVLDYLVKIENMPFRQAVETATGIMAAAPPPKLELPKPKTLVLPEAAGVQLRLYDYLCNKRGIDIGIVHSLIQNGKLYEDRRGNIVFVGHDEYGKPRYASIRGTHGNFRGDCKGSDKRYSFNVAATIPSDQLYIFESPIDLMSHASLVNAFKGDTGAWERCHRVSLSGTTDTAIPFFLNQHEAVKELVFSLDNDTAGNKAANHLMRKYADKGYFARIEPPYGKDFNEDLTQKILLEKSQKNAVKMHNELSI